jgi:hypothetical protein
MSKKHKGLLNKIKNRISAFIQHFNYKKKYKDALKTITKLEDDKDALLIENDNLKFQIDRDDKLTRIKYLEERLEEKFVVIRDLRSELKEKNKIIDKLNK